LNPSDEISIFTDGAASGNPGPGGYGIILLSGPHRKVISGGYRLTTNNRMELLAVIIGLEQLKIQGSRIKVYTDSRYVSEAINQGWLFDWERKGFKKKKNPDLWRRFLVVYRQHRVEFVWIKGHAEHPLNEECDRLAVEASKCPGLAVDPGYKEDTENSLF
jgi:ribonuclease HI